jgi:DNA repair protein RadA/Sms
VIEGSRPILIETQSLLSSSYAPMPRRTVVGYEANRVAMLLAIMEKFFNYNFSNLDLFVNLVGGLKTKDTSLDLSIITSIASNYLKKDLSSNCILIGEVGLNGEIRATPRVSEKINEAIRVGFKNILVPNPKIDSLNIKNDIKLIYVKNLTEVFNEIF